MSLNKYTLKKIMRPLKTNGSIKTEINDYKNKTGMLECADYSFLLMQWCRDEVTYEYEL